MAYIHYDEKPNGAIYPCVNDTRYCPPTAILPGKRYGWRGTDYYLALSVHVQFIPDVYNNDISSGRAETLPLLLCPTTNVGQPAS